MSKSALWWWGTFLAFLRCLRCFAVTQLWLKAFSWEKEAARDRPGTGTPAAVAQQCLQISLGCDSTATWAHKYTHTHTCTCTHTQKNQPMLPLLTSPTFSISFSDVQADETDTVKIGTAAPINPVFNLSQSLKIGCNWPNCGQSCLSMVQKSVGYPFTRKVDNKVGAGHSAWEQLQSIIFIWSLPQITYLIKKRTNDVLIEGRLEHSDALSLNISSNLCNSLLFLLSNPTLDYRAQFKVGVSFDQTQHYMTAAAPPGLHS